MSAVPRWIPGLVVASVLAVACTSGGDETDTAAPTTLPSTVLAVTTSTEPAPVVDPVEAVLATLTTEQKVGQLLMPLVFGRSATEIGEADRANNLAAFGYETPAEIVEAYHLGGVIYLGSNIESSEQLRTFSGELQAVSRESTGVGMLIAVDQEGGRVSRLADEVTVFPAADDMGDEPERVHESSYVTGQQVQQQGVNVVLAPVADVRADDRAFIGDRSFGQDPDHVASMVTAAVHGLQQSGVAATVKHWPGHGGTNVDSHNNLPSIATARDQWELREAVPFEAAIEADVAIVMVGHLAFPELDRSGLPATVSPELIDGLLRDELGFDGVVMTDALDMRAVDEIPQDQLVVRSLLAGADVMLQSLEPQRAYEGLLAAVGDGRISPERLDQAVTRVLRLKHDLGLLPASS